MSKRNAGGLHIASAGHAIFALSMIVLGILGLLDHDFTAIWQPVPKWVPARAVLAILCAAIALATGAGLLWRRTAAPAARALVAYLLLWFLVLRMPSVIRAPTIDAAWAACQSAILAAAAWVLYVWFAGAWDTRHVAFATGKSGMRIARVLYGLALIPLGISHFLYLKQTAVLVPRWLPWHVAWAIITGWAFIAAGVAVIVGVLARLAAALVTVQIGLFTVLVWLPIVSRGGATPFQRDEFLVSWALTACAWVVADSYGRNRHTSDR